MAIARSLIHKQGTFSADLKPLAEMYKRAILELNMRAKARLISDGRVLTSEAHRARILAREASVILERLDADAAQWIAENVPKAYLRGVKDAGFGLTEIGASVGVPQPLIHEEAIQLLVDDLQDTMEDMTRQIARGVRRTIRRTQLTGTLDKLVTENIAQGIISGRTRRETSNAIRRQLIDEFGEKPIRIGARNYQIDSYAEMVARTKTAEAQTAGMINRLAEEGHDLVMITAHGAKDGCGYYEGKVFSISGNSEKYPALASVPNGGPPFHPNCRHAAVPYVEELSSRSEKRRARGVPSEALGKSYAEVEKLAKQARRAA